MIRICPKCNKEIIFLKNIETGTIEHYLNLDIQGHIQYETREFESDSVIDQYCCPKCNEILLTSETEAINFPERRIKNDRL